MINSCFLKLKYYVQFKPFKCYNIVAHGTLVGGFSFTEKSMVEAALAYLDGHLVA